MSCTLRAPCRVTTVHQTQGQRRQQRGRQSMQFRPSQRPAVGARPGRWQVLCKLLETGGTPHPTACSTKQPACITPSRSCLARYAGWPMEAMSAASSSWLRPRITSPSPALTGGRVRGGNRGVTPLGNTHGMLGKKAVVQKSAGCSPPARGPQGRLTGCQGDATAAWRLPSNRTQGKPADVLQPSGAAVQA